jgi:hypothetical protein
VIWIDYAAVTVASDLSAAATVTVDDDWSISLLSNSRDMSSQDWHELMMSWRGCRFCSALAVVFRFCRWTKTIFKQNEKFERFDDMFIEKTKCIKEHVKLSKKLYSECYFVAAHILNRTSSQILSWDSSLIFMQKLLKKSIWSEIIHFKIYDCITFSLLKKITIQKKWKNEISSIH